MTTAIAIYTSEGCVARCDAKCHNAISPDCDCICGGRLHGVGADRAIEENTRDWLGDELTDEIKAFADRNGYDPKELRVGFTQQALFAEESS